MRTTEGRGTGHLDFRGAGGGDDGTLLPAALYGGGDGCGPRGPEI